MLFVRSTAYAFPFVCSYRLEGEVFAEVDFGAVRGVDTSGKFFVFFRCGKQFGSEASGRYSGVVFLAVEDGGMTDGTGYAGFPRRCVCAVVFARAVRKGQFYHTPESRLASGHAFLSAGGDDFIRPPSRSRLNGEHVFRSGAQAHSTGDVVGERQLRLLIMCEARFEYFLAYGLAVDVERVYSQTSCHPACTDNFCRVFD